MPGFVPDASATMLWHFEDEATPWTEALLDRIQGGEEVLVPARNLFAKTGANSQAAAVRLLLLATRTVPEFRSSRGAGE